MSKVNVNIEAYPISRERIHAIFLEITRRQRFTYQELEDAIVGYLSELGLTFPQERGEDVDNFTE